MRPATNGPPQLTAPPGAALDEEPSAHELLMEFVDELARQAADAEFERMMKARTDDQARRDLRPL